LSATTGTGTGSVSYAITANPNPAWRTGVVTIADQTLVLNQQPVVCTYKLSTTNRVHGYTGANNSVNVTNTSSGCSWSVTNLNDWISIVSPTSGMGNG